MLRKNNSKALIGFWKGNKMCGIGKTVIKNERSIYGMWKNNKMETEIFTQDEFYNILNKTYCGKYKFFFQKDYDELETYVNIIMNI